MALELELRGLKDVHKLLTAIGLQLTDMNTSRTARMVITYHRLLCQTFDILYDQAVHGFAVFNILLSSYRLGSVLLASAIYQIFLLDAR